MDFDDYFKKKENEKEYEKIDKKIKYCETIDDFYKKFIFHHFNRLMNDGYLKNWCTFIESIVSDEISVPIYWIRRYERVGIKDKFGNEIPNGKSAKCENGEYTLRWDNRRGALTIVTNEEGNAQYGYVYVSNFDAQEIYNMILYIENPKKEEFIRMLKDGSYYFHYDNGKSCIESDIAFYRQTGTTRAGILTKAGYYLAHINDVNGEYYENKEDKEPIEKEKIDELFPLGVADGTGNWSMVSEWKTLEEWCKDEINKKAIETAGVTLGKEKRIRIIKKSNDTDFDYEKKILKAYFLRFISPFNYFLVPAQKYSFNAITSKIGEYKPLIKYVNKKIEDLFKRNKDLSEHFKYFKDNILVSTKEDIDDETEESMQESIHILFGEKLSYLSCEDKLSNKGIKIKDWSEVLGLVEVYKYPDKRFFIKYECGKEKPIEKSFAPQKNWIDDESNDEEKKLTIKHLCDAINNKNPWEKKNEEIIVSITLRDKIKLNKKEMS